MDYPFDLSGIEVGEDGIRRYTGLPRNVVTMVRRSVEAHPERTALVEVGGERLTYAQLWDDAARVAGGLRERGVTRGNRVALRLPAGCDWVRAFLGTLLAGAVVVPVNTRLAAAEVDYVVGNCGAAVVLGPDGPLPDGDPLVVDDQAHTDVAAIFYTSGTTGFPKGAMTTHENFLSNVETCLRCVRVDRAAHQTTLISVPLFHVTGCNSQLLVALSIASTSVVLPTFDVAAFLTAVEAERVTMLTSVPAIYWLALHHPAFATTDVSTVRTLSYGGAPIAPDLVHRIAAAFPGARVGNGFGLTETSSVSSYLPHELAAEHADSVGFAAPVADLRIDDPDADGVGELLVRGPHVVAGYWEDPERTAATFVDGWLHTGDLARLDDGLLRVVDRAKDMINRGGENVYCVEVENALAAHPGIGEVAVLGVPDEVMGEKVGAVVVPLPGAGVTGRDVADFAAGVLADYKVPQYVALRGEPLPRNPGGKVVKPALRTTTSWGTPLR
ncbi:class I adenylate-forming enzyme family protein [Rhodococcus aerolatus]